ncbi:MAG: septum site-determining protein MinC [Gammaproteobacteria bacterium]
MSITASPLQKVALEFKSTSLTVPVVLLSSNDLAQIEIQLIEKISQAPEFFKNSPLLIDLQKLKAQDVDVDVRELVALLRKHALMPIGIRGGTEKQNAEILAMDLPVYSLYAGTTSTLNKTEPKTLAVPETDEVEPVTDHSEIENKIVTQPIRSGQRVYARGDLIVTATVSAGAEIMAEGNIHVYGTLRGRALAGVQGKRDSRIFCSDLQAELISIAGIYQLSDDISPESAHKLVQISLDNQSLIIKDI